MTQEQNVRSYINTVLRLDPVATINAGGVGLKLAMVIEDNDVTPPVPRDISGTITDSITFTDPSGNVTTAAAVFADFGSFAGDGTDGAIMVTASPGQFDEVGTWKAQARLVTAGGVVFFSETVRFVVRPSAVAP